jgi:VanZ family protein
MAALFAQSSIPDEGSELGQRVLGLIQPELHNLLHVPAYALLTWLWWKALVGRGWRSAAALGGSALIAIGYGAVEELHQYFVPGRSLSLTDAALNALGAALCVLLVTAVRANRQRADRRPELSEPDARDDRGATREPSVP